MIVIFPVAFSGTLLLLLAGAGIAWVLICMFGVIAGGIVYFLTNKADKHNEQKRAEKTARQFYLDCKARGIEGTGEKQKNEISLIGARYGIGGPLEVYRKYYELDIETNFSARQGKRDYSSAGKKLGMSSLLSAALTATGAAIGIMFAYMLVRTFGPEKGVPVITVFFFLFFPVLFGAPSYYIARMIKERWEEEEREYEADLRLDEDLKELRENKYRLNESARKVKTGEKKDGANQAAASRSGAPWTDQEDKQLLAECERGETLEEIARLHNRTVGSIRTRLKRLSKE